jgi:hypothetical protein
MLFNSSLGKLLARLTPPVVAALLNEPALGDGSGAGAGGAGIVLLLLVLPGLPLILAAADDADDADDSIMHCVIDTSSKDLDAVTTLGLFPLRGDVEASLRIISIRKRCSKEDVVVFLLLLLFVLLLLLLLLLDSIFVVLFVDVIVGEDDMWIR